LLIILENEKNLNKTENNKCMYLILVCKILAIELEGRLQETGKTSEYLEIGYSVDQPKKKKAYKKS